MCVCIFLFCFLCSFRFLFLFLSVSVFFFVFFLSSFCSCVVSTFVIWDDLDVTVDEDNVEATSSLTLPFSAAMRPSKISHTTVGNGYMSEFNKFIGGMSSPPNEEHNGTDVMMPKAKKPQNKSPRTTPYIHKSNIIDLQIKIEDSPNDATNSRHQSKTFGMRKSDGQESSTVSHASTIAAPAQHALTKEGTSSGSGHFQPRANNIRIVTDTQPTHTTTHTNHVHPSQSRPSHTDYSTTTASTSSTSQPYRIPLLKYSDKGTSASGLEQSRSSSISNNSSSSVGCDPSKWRTKDALTTK